MEEANVDDYTLHQLRAWLRHLGLPSGGNKAALVVRINDVPPAERGVCPTEETASGGENDAISAELEAESPCYDASVRRELELVKRELALVEKERQLLKMENELLKKRSEGRISETPLLEEKSALNFANIKDLLPEYDGNGSVELWVAQLEDFSKNFLLNDEITKALLVCKVKGSAQAWLHSKPDFMSADVRVLLDEMRNAFRAQSNKLLQRREFERRKWLSVESFPQYFTEKLKLSAGLQIEEAEMVEHLIEGITSYQLRTQATIQCFASPDELLRAFSKIKPPEVNKPLHNNTNDRIKRNDLRCYNCNSLGHYAKDCRKPKRETGACYGCGSLDHIITSCPQRKGVYMIEDINHIQGAQ